MLFFYHISHGHRRKLNSFLTKTTVEKTFALFSSSKIHKAFTKLRYVYQQQQQKEINHIYLIDTYRPVQQYKSI